MKVAIVRDWQRRTVTKTWSVTTGYYWILGVTGCYGSGRGSWSSMQFLEAGRQARGQKNSQVWQPR